MEKSINSITVTVVFGSILLKPNQQGNTYQKL